MGDQTILQVGVGGVLAILILRLVFDFLKSRKNGHDRSAAQLGPAVEQKINEMYQCLNVRGPTNERLIYGPPGLGPNVEKLGNDIRENTEAVHGQTRVLERVVDELKGNRAETAELNKALQNFLNLSRRS